MKQKYFVFSLLFLPETILFNHLVAPLPFPSLECVLVGADTILFAGNLPEPKQSLVYNKHFIIFDSVIHVECI